LPGPAGQDGQVEGHERVLQAGQFRGAAVADQVPHQFEGRAGERQVGAPGHGRPLGVVLARPLVPGLVDPGEALVRRAQAVGRARPGGGHVDVEDPGEGGLGGEEPQESADASPQRLLVGRAAGHRAGRRDNLFAQEPAAHAGRREEAVFLAAEMRVERGAGHPGPAHDSGDRHGGVPRFRDRRYDGPQQPLALYGAYLGGRQPVPAPRQSWLPLVRTSKITRLLRGGRHRSTVTGKSLKYAIVL
jgi:hypothetical protein